MSVLVTGGAGYIGSHTAVALRDAGHEVIVLDTLERGSVRVDGTSLVVGDVADSRLVQDLVADRNVSSIVHFAAYKSVAESMESPGRYFRNNVDGTVRLFESALAAGARTVVFSSSCSVVGTPDRVPVTEDAVVHPESVYAETKAIVERILHWYSSTKGLRAVSLRYFNAAGASSDGSMGEDWTYSQNLVPLAMKSLLLGEPRLQVFGSDYDTPDGTCIRDYIHVEDLARAHVAALRYLADGGPSTVLNVGTGVGASVFEVLHEIEAVAGRPVPFDVVGRRAGDPVATYADPTRAASTLGWRSEHGLRHIVETAYRWHRGHIE